jgi:voltage-gated potassium channel
MKGLAIGLAIAGVLAIGTVFYSHVEGWSYFDALYFSVMTLTTVGYGDFTPSSDLSKAFTMIYVFVGIGIVFGSVMILGERAHERIFSMTDRKKEQDVPRV